MNDRNPNALRNTSMFMVKAGSETMIMPCDLDGNNGQKYNLSLKKGLTYA